MPGMQVLKAAIVSPAVGAVAAYLVILLEHSDRAVLGISVEVDDASRIANKIIPDWFLVAFYFLLCWLVVIPITALASKAPQFRAAGPLIKGLPVALLLSIAATFSMVDPRGNLIVALIYSTVMIGIPIYTSAAAASLLLMPGSARN